jgi:hypothetical protein
MLRFTFLMRVAVSFRPRFIISLKRSTFLPFRSAKMGREADYPIWVSHGHAASCSLLLTASETRQDRVLQARKGNLHIAVLRRRVGGKSDGSNFDSPASTSAKVEAVAEGEFEAEPAA